MDDESISHIGEKMSTESYEASEYRDNSRIENEIKKQHKKRTSSREITG